MPSNQTSVASYRVATLQRHLQGVGLRLTSATQHHQGVNMRDGGFRYTLDNPRLTLGQRKFYEENGYLVIPKLIDADLLDDCRKRFVDICDGRVDAGQSELVKDISLKDTGAQGEYLYNKINLATYDDVLARYCLNNELLDYVECFTGHNIYALNNMLINKPPDSGKLTSRHPLHQDHCYLPYDPVDRLVTAWTAMERITKDNGCLIIIPGTHKLNLQEHQYPDWEGGVNKTYYGIKQYEDHPVVHLEMDVGDTVFFHHLLIHGSGANLTKGFRKAMTSHYASTECTFKDIRGSHHEVFVAEMQSSRGKHKMDYSDLIAFFKFSRRLARGREVQDLYC